MAAEKDREWKLLHSDSLSLSEVGNIKSMARVASSTNLFHSQNGDDHQPKQTKGVTRHRTLSLSLPSSRMVSRSASPIQVKTRPLLHAATVPLPLDVHKADEPDGENAALVEEIKSLKAQVEELTSKSRNLEAELESKSRELKEATEKVADEAEKSRAAKEVIKQLTSQLKEMGERLSKEEALTSQWNGTSSSNGNGQSLPNSVRALAQKPEESMVQDKPGVYISICSSPGGNELKRVRFREQRAETWWGENVTKVLERHNIRLLT